MVENTDGDDWELSLWRNYEEGKVGLQMEGMPRILLEPDEARQRADTLEERMREEYPEHLEQCLEHIETMRRFADEVENASSGD